MSLARSSRGVLAPRNGSQGCRKIRQGSGVVRNGSRGRLGTRFRPDRAYRAGPGGRRSGIEERGIMSAPCSSQHRVGRPPRSRYSIPGRRKSRPRRVEGGSSGRLPGMKFAVPRGQRMSHYADKVLGLVGRADYKPITLKAMSRRFEVGPDDYAEFRSAVKGLVSEGRLDLAKDKTLSKPERARGDHRRLQAVVEGVRVRPPAQVDRRSRTRSSSRPRPAATPPAATRSSSRSPSGPRGRG